MAPALTHAVELLEPWLADHETSFPPIVFNITDAEANVGGDPAPASAAVRDLATSDGTVLLFNIHVSSDPSPSVLFPSDRQRLPDDFARKLFSMSSELPSVLRRRAAELGLSVQEGARGFAFNADMTALLMILHSGTPLGLPTGDSSGYR
jgi:hypothetical protein